MYIRRKNSRRATFTARRKRSHCGKFHTREWFSVRTTLLGRLESGVLVSASFQW